MTSPLIASRATVRNIVEHKRTVFARKDPLDPQMTVHQEVSLGWFLHLDFGPESGPISICIGPEFPRHITVGDKMIVAIFKEADLRS